MTKIVIEHADWRQEFRAYTAERLIGLALRIHFRATMDLARRLAELQR